MTSAPDGKLAEEGIFKVVGGGTDVIVNGEPDGIPVTPGS
jgi:hypothetical protein